MSILLYWHFSFMSSTTDNMRHKTFLLMILGLATFLLTGCGNRNSRYIPEVKSSELPKVNIHIKRYGQALFELDTASLKTGLERIKPEFKLFLNADLNDNANINQLKAFVTDTLNRYLYRHAMQIFPNLNHTEQQLSSAMAHYLHYFPHSRVPVFYSYISGGFYEAPVIVADSVVLIGIDNYLGSSFEHYARLGIPRYKMHWMVKDEITPDVMRALYESMPVTLYKPKNLLDMMVAAGKELFFLDAMIPTVADSLKIKYTKSQLAWVNKNEKNIWGFLISQQLLFSADFMQTKKLMQDGPFTKGFEEGAPARIGEWVGWQIISAYMQKHPEVSLKQLLKLKDAQMILNESGYKP